MIFCHCYTALKDRRSAHSGLQIPIALDRNSACNVFSDSSLADDLRRTHFIVRDEIIMSHRYNLEAVDKMLRDIVRSHIRCGGKVLLLVGNFLQILLIICQRNRSQISSAFFKRSRPYPFLKKHY